MVIYFRWWHSYSLYVYASGDLTGGHCDTFEPNFWQAYPSNWGYSSGMIDQFHDIPMVVLPIMTSNCWKTNGWFYTLED